MLVPNTIATVVGKEQAASIAEHIVHALDSGAESLFLLTTTETVPDDPQSMADFPPPDIYIFHAVYVIGLGQDVDHLQAQVSEHVPRVD